NPDEAGNLLFAEGDRSRWFMLQPYLIGLLLAKGLPLLYQGQEFGENYYLPDFGEGRVGLLRPLRWDYFYDGAGQQLTGLTRKLLGIRRTRDHIRHGNYFSSTTGGVTSNRACSCSRAMMVPNTRWLPLILETRISRCHFGFRSAATTSKSYMEATSISTA